MTTWKHRRTRHATALAACAIGLGMAGSAAAQQLFSEPVDQRLSGLGRLYAEDGVNVLRDQCTSRMPQTRAAWDDALKQWHDHNRVALAELQRLQEQVDAALRTHPAATADFADWMAIASARVVFMNYFPLSLGSANDLAAKQSCDSMRERFIDTTFFPSEMDEGREAVAAALEILTKPR